MNISFNNSIDFYNYLNKMICKEPPKNVTNEQIKEGYPILNFLKFINLTNPPENWIKLESYMYVNGQKIEESFPENKKICDSLNFYKIGCIFEKNNDTIIFTTYTSFQNKCVLNHKSIHNLNGNLTGGKINLFDSIHEFKYYGDGEDYVNKILEELISEKDTFKWDVIEIKDDACLKSNNSEKNISNKNTYNKKQSSKNILKALLLCPGKKPEYVDFDFNDGGACDFLGECEGISLFGAEYKHLMLAIFFNELSDNEPINMLGSAIASYLKTNFTVQPIIIRGKVLITDDDGDMNEEKLKIIKNIIQTKKDKIMPTELKHNTDKLMKNLKKDANNIKLNKKDTLFLNKVAGTLNESHYGLKVGNFPEWL